MDFQILGRLEVLDEGRGSVAVAGSKQRALLALLLLHGNETLSTARLIDELWGEAPPATAAKTVQVHVSRLRKSLAAGGEWQRLGRARAHARARLRAAPGPRAARRGPVRAAARRGEERARGGTPGACRLDPRACVGAVARAAPGRPRLRAVRAARDRPARGAEGGCARAADRGQARARSPCRSDRGARDADPRAPVPRAPARAPDARPLSQRPAGGGAAGLPGRAPPARRGAGDRAGASSCATSSAPSSRRTRRCRCRRRRRSSRRRSSRPARRSSGARATWNGCARSGGRHGRAPGRLAVVVGARGMGKTRLAAELAAEVRREGASVLYLDGAGQPLAVPAVLEQVRAARRAALVVLDDVDRAGEDVRAAIEAIVAGAAERPLLLLATAEDEVLAARLGAAATRSLTPLGAAGVRAVAQLYAGPRADEDVPVELLLEASGGVPLRAHRVAAEWARAEAEGRLDAAAGRAASGRTGLRVAEDELAGNVVELQAVRRRTATRCRVGSGRVPVQGPRRVRHRGRPRVLRPRAAGRRDGGAPGGRAADGRRRALRQRQVLRAAGRAAGRAGRRRAARERALAAGAAATRRAPAGRAGARDGRRAGRRPHDRGGRSVRGDLHGLS